MPPFHTPTPVLRGCKERIESLAINGDKLYAGTSTGKLQVLQVEQEGDRIKDAVIIMEKNVGRKPIEQLDYIKDLNSLVVLSDSSLSIMSLPNLDKPLPLPQARYVYSFAIHSAVEIMPPVALSSSGSSESSNDHATNRLQGSPAMVTVLVAGCNRKLVVFTWKDGEAQAVKECTLPHSPRALVFITPQTLYMAYSVTEHALFSLDKMVASDVILPSTNTSVPSGIGGMSKGALSGLGGYMTLGMGKRAKPLVLKLQDGEVLIPKESTGVFLSEVGTSSRSENTEWPAAPDELSYVKPYFLAVLPSGSVPDLSPSGSQIVQIRSSLSLLPVQTLTPPFVPTVSSTPAAHVIRLLTATPTAKSPLYFTTTPSDRTIAASEGSTIWMLRLKHWSEQIDELVESALYKDALALLDIIDQATLPDKVTRQAQIRALHAVAIFRNGEYDNAINTFIELDINPAKIIALFPREISGRLFVEPDRWIQLFGGPEKPTEAQTKSSKSNSEVGSRSRSGSLRPASPAGSLRVKRKSTVEGIIQATATKDDDAVSISGRMKEKVDPFRRSIETLVRYLSDRRPKIMGSLEAMSVTPAESQRFPLISEASIDELFALPNVPLDAQTPEQLTKYAQIIDTALFKSYLLIRPALLGPLCRLDNWCEVSEMEEVLRERGKNSELIFLYKGKKMHAKALALLRQLAEKEEDAEDMLRPTVSYLQKLGPECMEQVFSASRWIFEHDKDIGFEIFTSEEAELPRLAVADFLEDIDPQICAKYVEFLIAERNEVSETFHDRLADIYLRLSIDTRKKQAQDASIWYSKLLNFIDTTDIYRTDRLFGLLPGNDLFEARAILLGRLGRHDAALETFVYRLQDYIKAEEYCKRIYIPHSPTADIYLVLLRIYLRPAQGDIAALLRAALELISRHGPRLDTVETLQLLPPMVTAQDVKVFLYDALRQPLFDAKVLREISKSRNDHVARKLMTLQSKRVKITDARICPHCNKRIGNSVIAVHAPRGEVTHYQCREAFIKSRQRKHSTSFN